MQELLAPAVELLERLGVGDIVHQHASLRPPVKGYPETLKSLLSRSIPYLQQPRITGRGHDTSKRGRGAEGDGNELEVHQLETLSWVQAVSFGADKKKQYLSLCWVCPLRALAHVCVVGRGEV